MFEIKLNKPHEVTIRGRLDAANAKQAEDFLDNLSQQFVIDLSGLEYISSAGLGVLLKTHKRLLESGASLKLVQVNSHIGDIFKYTGFNKLFEIEPLLQNE